MALPIIWVVVLIIGSQEGGGVMRVIYGELKHTVSGEAFVMPIAEFLSIQFPRDYDQTVGCMLRHYPDMGLLVTGDVKG